MSLREPATITTTEDITINEGDSWRDIQAEYNVDVDDGVALIRDQGDDPLLVLREEIQQPLIDNWPFEEVIPYERHAIYDHLYVWDGQLNRLDQTITDIKKQKFIDTATGKSLDLLAEEVGVIRETNESDERLRFRTQISKAIPQSTTDVRSFAELLRVLFGEDAENISLTIDNDEPVVILIIPEDVIDQVPLTLQELEDELQQVVPSGDNIVVQPTDLFSFEGTTFGEGFGEGTWK